MDDTKTTEEKFSADEIMLHEVFENARAGSLQPIGIMRGIRALFDYVLLKRGPNFDWSVSVCAGAPREQLIAALLTHDLKADVTGSPDEPVQDTSTNPKIFPLKAEDVRLVTAFESAMREHGPTAGIVYGVRAVRDETLRVFTKYLEASCAPCGYAFEADLIAGEVSQVFLARASEPCVDGFVPLYRRSPSRERLTPEMLDAIVAALPGGATGYCKTWGYVHLADAIQDALGMTRPGF